MEQNFNKNPELKKEVLKNFYNKNKRKFFLFIFTGIIAIISIFLWNESLVKKNNIISEKYVKAGVMILSGDNKNAKNYYEEIILSKNKFYSLLALNTIIEKKLTKDKKKIIQYFEILEGKNYNQGELDLISFKKALFLIKNSEKQKGEIILKKLIEKESNLKALAQEIVNQ